MSSDELTTVIITEPPSRGSSENIIVRCTSEEVTTQEVSAPKVEEKKKKKKRVSKEIYTITKLMIPAVPVAVILVNKNNNRQLQDEFKSWVACVETSTQLVALLLMLSGIYVRVVWPIVSKWMQLVGHFICVTCLMIFNTPLLRLPLPPFVWVLVIPLPLLLALLLVIFYRYLQKMKMKMKMLLIVLSRPSWITTIPIPRQPISGVSSASQGAVEDV